MRREPDFLQNLRTEFANGRQWMDRGVVIAFAVLAGLVAPAPVRQLPLVALRETVIFPEMSVALQGGREKSVNAVDAAA